MYFSYFNLPTKDLSNSPALKETSLSTSCFLDLSRHPSLLMVPTKPFWGSPVSDSRYPTPSLLSVNAASASDASTARPGRIASFPSIYSPGDANDVINSESEFAADSESTSQIATESYCSNADNDVSKCTLSSRLKEPVPSDIWEENRLISMNLHPTKTIRPTSEQLVCANDLGNTLSHSQQFRQPIV
ncbi:unnamed protein product [Protopolystoma xenopodis]|uniref:Uncharacterized protein n=1 Tax=Protopolystoma xenopodis TaxID=117903 RepID=A0A3S4ZXI5_9PLAT|nr:unnamed protein product [Protopolystoma xenopodis]